MTLPWLQAVEAEFAERLRSDRLAHALLLYGPADTGKVDLARRFMAAALCLGGEYPACGACRSCQLLSGGAHPDGHVLTFEEHPKKPGTMRTELVVDQVRELTGRLFLTNTISRRKAALVFPVEEANMSALNALLKTLEEPPGDTLLILVAHNRGRLPATIRSRCQALAVRMPEHGEALRWTMSEGGLDEADAEAALEAAAGSPLRAVRLAREGGALARFRELREGLEKLRRGAVEPGPLLSAFADEDAERLWAWISLHAAADARQRALSGADARALLDLQRQADGNRRMAPSPVRKDFLLQDWLIQWARLSV